MNNHKQYTMLEKLDFLAGVGHYFSGDSITRAGIPEGNVPVLVFSLITVMDFDEKVRFFLGRK